MLDSQSLSLNPNSCLHFLYNIMGDSVPSLLIGLSLLLLLPVPVPASGYSDSLSEGSSLSVEDPSHVLVSPNGVFSSGFYPVGENAYSFAIWYSKPSCSRNECTVVWMANRDLPVNGRRSELSLQNAGNLILTDAGKSIAWSTDSVSVSTTELQLKNNGNLVLSNEENLVLWQSFDSPTDTLLPSQQFTKEKLLVSSKSRTNFSSGNYKMLFDSSNLLRLLYDGPQVSSLYWPFPWLDPFQAGRVPYNSSRVASFDSSGMFVSSDNLNFLPSDYGRQFQRRLTLGIDGNLRMYSRGRRRPKWRVTWQALWEPCRVHGICGQNSVCSYAPASGSICSCSPGHKMKYTTDWSYGCEPEFNVTCVGNTTSEEVGFIHLPNSEFYGYDTGYYEDLNVEECEQKCLQSCECKAYQYRVAADKSQCYPKNFLTNGQHAPGFSGDVYLKVPKSLVASYKERESLGGYNLDCEGAALVRQEDRIYSKGSENGTLKFMVWFASAFGGVEIVCILLVLSSLMVRSHKNSVDPIEGYHLAGIGFKRFSYSDLKKATKKFSEEVGRGAGGIVYKGTFSDNRVVAVKQLHVANQGEAEFLAEVTTIGDLHHMNLIEMLGYCVEGKHRMLVYEYMEHGSLGDSLSCKELDWEKRFEISLGTARGLAYLHEECLEWVLHCDVKPQNILLDSMYRPKVSDFGLSKLLRRDDDMKKSTFSKIRGTRGYMAPEWVFNLPITSKVDVYSYGIVVLEMVTGKSAVESENTRLVAWVREKKDEGRGGWDWVEEIVDPMLQGKYDKEKMEMVVMMALQCVEEDRDARPTMSQVVQMLMRHEID